MFFKTLAVNVLKTEVLGFDVFIFHFIGLISRLPDFQMFAKAKQSLTYVHSLTVGSWQWLIDALWDSSILIHL